MTNRNHLLKLLRELLAKFDVSAHPEFDARSSEQSIALSFQYNDLQLRLLHSEAPQIQHLGLIECRLGPVAPADEEPQYEQLLDLNYRLCATNGTFAIDAEGGDAMYAFAFEVDRVDLATLTQLIESMEPIHAEWLRTGLMDEEETPDAVPGVTQIGSELLQP